MPNEIIEECLEEMATPKIKKRIAYIGMMQNPIPMENIKLAYEQATNKSWNEEFEEE